MSNYIFKHLNGKTSIFTSEQILENAREQKAAGINPHYRFNFGNEYGAPGYLVCSGLYGCIVAILTENGGYIQQGLQGDFVYDMSI